jgi:hypothetical protein
MLKVEINEKIYLCPENWNEVYIGQLMKLNKSKEIEYESWVDQMAATIEALSGIDRAILMDWDLNEFKELGELFKWSSEMPSDIITDKEIYIDDVKYIPLQFDLMPAGDFISIEVFQKENAVENIHLIASVLIRPEVDGRIEPLKDMLDIMRRGELFKEKLNIGFYWPHIQAFFHGAVSSFSTNLEASSDQPKKPKRFKIVNS